MTENETIEKLRRTGTALSPDPARLKALLIPQVQAMPSPLSASLYVRSAVGALALVLVVVTGAVWSTTPTIPSVDEYAQFSAVLDADLLDETEVVALLDQGVDAVLTEADVFTDEFLDSVLYL